MTQRVRRPYTRRIVSWSRRAIMFALCALLLERWIERALHSTMFELASVARGVPPGSYALQRSDNRASSPPSAFLSAAHIPRALCLRTPASVSPRTAAAVASYARMHRGAIRTIKLHEAGGVGAEALTLHMTCRRVCVVLSSDGYPPTMCIPSEGLHIP